MLDPKAEGRAPGPAKGPAQVSPTDWIAAVAVLASIVVTGTGATLAFVLRVSKDMAAVRVSLGHIQQTIDGGFARLDREIAEERAQRRAEIADVRASIRAERGPLGSV